MNQLQKKKENVALLSILSNTFLMLAKIVTGIMTGSVSVISEAVHSAVDLFASMIAFFAVRMSGQPADEDHPYGHGKIENISGFVEAILIFGAGFWIVYESVHKLLHPAPMDSTFPGLLVMGISVIMNRLVSAKLMKVGEETDSAALIADAWHLKTDIWTSAGVFAAMAAITLGRYIFSVNLEWIDPLAAIAVSVMILKAGWHLTIEAGRDLLDARLPEEEYKWIYDCITTERNGYHGIHKLKTRKAGAIRFVEFHMLVDDDMTVECAHAMTDDIGHLIKARYPGTQVNIHIEPKAHAKTRKIHTLHPPRV